MWDRLYQELLAELHAAGDLEWSRAVIDGSHVACAEDFIRAGESHDARRSRMLGFVSLEQHGNAHGEAVAAA